MCNNVLDFLLSSESYLNQRTLASVWSALYLVFYGPHKIYQSAECIVVLNITKDDLEGTALNIFELFRLFFGKTR